MLLWKLWRIYLYRANICERLMRSGECRYIQICVVNFRFWFLKAETIASTRATEKLIFEECYMVYMSSYSVQYTSN